MKNSRKTVGILLLAFFPVVCFSQSNDKVQSFSSDTTIYDFPDELAQFPGGMEEMRRYFYEKLYRLTASFSRDSLRSIDIFWFSFVVETDGRVTELEIVSSHSPEIALELLKAVQEMPDWIPAKLEGETVRSSTNLPIYLGEYDFFQDYSSIGTNAEKFWPGIQDLNRPYYRNGFSVGGETFYAGQAGAEFASLKLRMEKLRLTYGIGADGHQISVGYYPAFGTSMDYVRLIPKVFVGTSRGTYFENFNLGFGFEYEVSLLVVDLRFGVGIIRDGFRYQSPNNVYFSVGMYFPEIFSNVAFRRMPFFNKPY
jgi:hypothetical protein